MLKKFNIRKPLQSDSAKASEKVVKKVNFTNSPKRSQIKKFFSIFVLFCFYFQDENRTLIDRLMKYKIKDAEKMNDENESFLK